MQCDTKGFSVHVSESLTRGVIGEPRKQPGHARRRTPRWVTTSVKPWVTPTTGGQAKPWAATRVNPEQASKGETRVPILLHRGEGYTDERDPRRALVRPAGVMGAARGEGHWINVGDPSTRGVATLDAGMAGGGDGSRRGLWYR
jgi:hypothetical protein